MIKTIYKCDNCGNEWDATSDEEQLCTIAIAVKLGSTTISDWPRQRQQHWCRTCIMSKGMVNPIISKDKGIAPEVQPSFEDKVVELLNTIGFEQT